MTEDAPLPLTPRTEAAIALNVAAHELMPGMRHDFGLVALALLEDRGWTLTRAAPSEAVTGLREALADLEKHGRTFAEGTFERVQEARFRMALDDARAALAAQPDGDA